MALKWIQEHDLLTFHVDRDKRQGDLHKRDMLSDMQSFFDPIGYTSPFILKGKLIFLELNRTVPTLPWEGKVHITLVHKWRGFMKSSEDLCKLTVPQWFQSVTCESHLMLHVFTNTRYYASSAFVSVTSGRAAYRSQVIVKS